MMARHDWHWTFGNGAHISFPGGGEPVTTAPPHAFNSSEGCATWSDSSGNLVFYTDGTRLYDAANTVINPGPGLGGTSSSAHSAIIVPPAGTGTLFHILTTRDWDSTPPNPGPLTHTTVAVAGGVSIASGPTSLTTFGPQRAAEKLAATSHKDCNKYWVVSLNIGQTPTGGLTGPGTFYSMLIDSDAGPLPDPGHTIASTFSYTAWHGYCIKFSPDGTLLAVTSYPKSIDLFNFDRATGAISVHSKVDTFPVGNGPYGIEFSPNGKYIYFSSFDAGYVRRHTIPASGAPATAFSSTTPIGSWTPTSPTPSNYRVGALQLAPNGRIYGTKMAQNGLLVIGDPNNATAVQFNAIAQTTSGPLILNGTGFLGLPTFTRIAADCGDTCRELAAAVDAQLAGTPKLNALRPCNQTQPIDQPPCRAVDLPHVAPWTSIRWGDSECDCIEGDDTEVLSLVVCNPYRNLTLSKLVVHQLVVVQANGAPVPNLPDGSPSIALTPMGPYCFDDLAPCTCTTRQFVLRLRGAPGGPYRILVRGICFDACFHGNEDDCFLFNVCKD